MRSWPKHTQGSQNVTGLSQYSRDGTVAGKGKSKECGHLSHEDGTEIEGGGNGDVVTAEELFVKQRKKKTKSSKKR